VSPDEQEQLIASIRERAKGMDPKTRDEVATFFAGLASQIQAELARRRAAAEAETLPGGKAAS
jgi:hypothetical protein